MAIIIVTTASRTTRVILIYISSLPRVRLLASVPGRHIGINKDKWGHMKLRKVWCIVCCVLVALFLLTKGLFCLFIWS